MKRILLLILLVFGIGNAFGQIAQFNFPASNSLVVSAKNTNVTVSNMALSAGTIETNITIGSSFLIHHILKKLEVGLLQHRHA